jgi:hypothetical protein
MFRTTMSASPNNKENNNDNNNDNNNHTTAHEKAQTGTHGMGLGWSATSRRHRNRLPPMTSSGALRGVADRGSTVRHVALVSSKGRSRLRLVSLMVQQQQQPQWQAQRHTAHRMHSGEHSSMPSDIHIHSNYHTHPQAAASCVTPLPKRGPQRTPTSTTPKLASGGKAPKVTA